MKKKKSTKELKGAMVSEELPFSIRSELQKLKHRLITGTMNNVK